MNGSQTATASISASNSVFGDRLNVGRRVLIGNPEYVFDGWLAHLILFSKSLTTEEEMLWSSLLADDEFRFVAETIEEVFLSKLRF